MRINKNASVFFALILCIIISGCVSRPRAEIDAVCVVEKVVDGDTLWVRSLKGFKENQSFKVRLADIDAWELHEAGGVEAREFLKSLISNHTQVYLDVDDNHPYDRYGRVIAIVYLKLNETHYLNLNYVMVVTEHARWVDYKNAWHPENFRKMVEINRLDSILFSR